MSHAALAGALRQHLNNRLLDADRFETAVRKIADAEPHAMARDIVRRIDHAGSDVVVTHLSTQQEVAEWILNQDEIVMLLEHKKINAIKEVRSHIGLGLKEAKDAVERAAEMQRAGYLNRRERLALEKEERAAIASILGTV